MTNAVETQAVETATPEELATAAQLAYDKVADPNKVQGEAKVDLVQEQATETLPDTAKPEQPSEIADLRKRLDDVNGKYGRLSQRFEETLKTLATPAKTQSAAAESVVDVEDLLKDIKETFGEDELYTSLKGAFSKVLANKGSVDPDSIGKMVATRLAADKEAEVQASLKRIVGDTDNPGRHPDFFQVKATPEFAAWQKTLPARERTLLSKSFDEDYVADMLDEFKDWDKAEKLKASVSKPSHQKTQSRLNAAVLPTGGTKTPPKGEPSAIEQAQAAYDKIAGKRL